MSPCSGGLRAGASGFLLKDTRPDDVLADRLFMAHATAKAHVSRLLTKLACRDRAQLVMIAYEVGIAVPGTTTRSPEDV